MIRISTAVLLLGLLAACETVQGFGRDVSTGGQAIEESAVEAEQGL